MSTRIRLVLATLTLAVVAEACISDASVAPEKPIDSLEAALADVTLPALDYAVGDVQRRRRDHADDRPVALSVRGDVANVRLRRALRRRALVLNQHYTLLDAAGGRQSAYDMTTTAGLVVNSAVSGTAISGATRSRWMGSRSSR